MHEMAIATELLAHTLSAVEAHADPASPQPGNERIEEVEVEVGLMRLVVPEALELAWQAACEGTAAEGASITITEVPLAARCRSCGRTFDPEIDNYLCPDCNEADVEICAGNDIVLKTVTCRSKEG